MVFRGRNGGVPLHTVSSTNRSTTPTNDEPNHIPAAPPPAPKKSLK